MFLKRLLPERIHFQNWFLKESNLISLIYSSSESLESSSEEISFKLSLIYLIAFFSMYLHSYHSSQSLKHLSKYLKKLLSQKEHFKKFFKKIAPSKYTFSKFFLKTLLPQKIQFQNSSSKMFLKRLLPERIHFQNWFLKESNLISLIYSSSFLREKSKLINKYD